MVISDVTPAEIIVSNNEAEKIIKIGPMRKPDMSILATGIGFDPASEIAREGDTVTMSAFITNEGELDGMALVEFYNGDPDDSGILLGNDSISVDVGGSDFAQITWEPLEEDYEIWVLIVNITPLEDNDSANNRAFKQLIVGAPPRSDLTVVTSSMTWVPSAPRVGNIVALEANLTNVGEVQGKAAVKFWLGDPNDGGTLLYTIPTVTVDVDALVPVKFPSWEPNATGMYNLTITVEGVTPEDSNLTNNSAWVLIDVGIRKQSDLHIVGFVLSSMQANKGDTVKVTLRVANNGSMAASTFTVKFYLDEAMVISETVDGGVGPYTFTDIVVNWRVDALPGTHTYKVWVDALEQVNESNEDNNLAEITINVPEEDPGGGLIPGFQAPLFIIGSLVGVVVASFRRARRRSH